ncbi:hypothetical protein IW261DRAFT_1455894 [Armillaria novae-zelandiae]|uniref:Uncharacterized protein n=1 Tax=Armillaria novae-zelandiae TaxID=153914 RepID=A0AA39PNQ9_9AGAR|nr:hypothetical protein IW261DRAFT_1455894 [Armillaria novae-zelandiae]
MMTTVLCAMPLGGSWTVLYGTPFRCSGCALSNVGMLAVKWIVHKPAHNSETKFQADDIFCSTSIRGLILRLRYGPKRYRHLRVREIEF